MFLFEFVRAGWTIALIIAAPAYIVLQTWSLRHLRGGWRHAALLPLLLAMSLTASLLDGHGGTGPALAAALTFTLIGALYLATLVGLTHLVRRHALERGSRTT